jgi:FAD-dependent oxidoreductase family protein
MRILVWLALTAHLCAESRSSDVVVYGATAGGVIAAVAAAGEGASVTLLEPGRHVGGMVSGGLGRTDMDRQQHLIGGMAREFFQRVGRHYAQDLSWFFEPKVAERVFRDWLAEKDVRVVYGQPLLRVRKEQNRIAELVTRDGGSYTARIFVDATYEGDLYKAAGVSYAVGRESRNKYGESFAGRQELLPGSHQLRVPTSPFDDNGKLVPYVRPEEDLVPVGEGDGKVMAYGYRLCLSNDPVNRVPIGKPDGYDPARFGLVRNYVKALGAQIQLRDFAGISNMPNNKTDLNASIVSTNLLGAGLAYVEAGFDARKTILEEHRSWAHGLLYFLANDQAVPEKLRREVSQWGLAKDEFEDTNHWPHQLYIRDARRMLGEYILTQHDLQTNTRKYDSIGMAAYNVDIREIQWIAKTVTRFPNIGKEVMMEGYLSVPIEPYEIPYRSLLPKWGACANLLVPVAISASHVAYASFRMEPQYMIAGQSAGVAAAMAARADISVHHVDIRALQQRLRQARQILTVSEALSSN